VVDNALRGGLSDPAPTLRFGVFELDVAGEQLRKSGVTVRLQPQPFKLLRLLVAQPGRLVTRDEIRAALWASDTFVDFDQAVNFAIKQVRDALDDSADRPLYIQTVPKRGYRFVAPVEAMGVGAPRPLEPRTDLKLHKALWANIVELRLAEESRRKRRNALALVFLGIVLIVSIAFLTRSFW
jgi:DNA-binding winged helix-turn-helix (wHTH) protein